MRISFPLGSAAGTLMFAALAWSAAAGASGLDASTAKALDAALAGPQRSDANKARDVYRKPREVLDFLGLRSDMTVVELWPGTGWYTEILAPALKDKGRLYTAQFSVNPTAAYQRRALGKFLLMLGEAPKIYGDVVVTHLALPDELAIAPAGSADMVLTFRNVHNWFMPANGGGEHADLVFRAVFQALKPGGVFGVVDHRWPDPETEDPQSRNGYISEERVIRHAEAAGFRLAGRSDVLRNPKDTHEHPEGVWTLPPSFALGDKDRARYEAIGESDRFVLKFTRPAK